MKYIDAHNKHMVYTEVIVKCLEEQETGKPICRFI